MNLETHFALGLKYSKHSKYLDIKFLFKLMTEVLLPSFELQFLLKNMLSCEEFVSSSRGSAFPPVWVRWVSSCIPAPPSAGEVLVVAHVCWLWEADGIWWRRVCYSYTSSLITWTLWWSMRSLFFLVSWYHNKHCTWNWEKTRFGSLEEHEGVVGPYCDCQCSVSAQRTFLGVNQSLSQRKAVNSSRKRFGVSFSEKTGVVWPFVSLSLWSSGSIFTEHCIIFLALFSWMLKPCGVYCFLMFSLTGRVRMLQKWTEESLCIETESWKSSSWGTWALLQLMIEPAELQWHGSPAKPSLPGLVRFVLKICGVLIRLQKNWGGFFNFRFLLIMHFCNELGEK